MAEGTDFLGFPHPHIRLPLLYIPNVPNEVKWNQIATVFKPCGAVTSRGRDIVTTNRGVFKRLTVAFQTVFQAEMALATLQGAEVPGTNPPFFLEICSSPNLLKAAPSGGLLPQYIRNLGRENEVHPAQQASAQDVFTWFRRAGPLVSVRVQENVGWPHPTCVLQYWLIPHAQYARLNCGTLHPTLQGMPPFALRTHDPRKLYCSGLGSSFTNASLTEMFGRFGQIVECQMKRVGVPDSFGFVSFTTEQQTKTAMETMNGTRLEGRAIVVRFHEPNYQGIFRPQAPPKVSLFPDPKPHTAPKWGDTAAEADRERERDEAQKKTGEDETPKKPEKMGEREEMERKRKEAEWLRREEEKREAARNALRDELRRANVRQERERVERLTEQARLEWETANTEMQDAEDRFDEATQAYSDFEEPCAKAAEAVLEAERALQAAKARRVKVGEASLTALLLKNATETTLRDARVRVEKAEKEKERLRRWSEDIARSEEAMKSAQAADEEAEEQRLAELAESIRKMNEMREQEEADRREKAKQEKEEKEFEERRKEQERLAQEEQLRKEEEEKARELLERKRREEARQQAYREASQRERDRCHTRDYMPSFSKSPPWTKERAVTRFKAVSAEFDEIKFCSTQPLTFESVPWPLIRPPLAITFDDIEWGAVEEFFAAAELVVDAAEYRSLVEKAHRRFHPDKWRARGLLLTVLDEDLRRRLEEAGNVVAQAITPLWLASKVKK